MIGRSAGHLRGTLLPLALMVLGLSGTPALAQHGDGPATDRNSGRCVTR